MLYRIIIALILVPLAEIVILVYLGRFIGIWPTIAIVLATGLIGAFTARKQGLKTLYNIRSSMASGILPADQFLQGALIFTGGLLVLTPGLMTDLAGLGLLIPRTRLKFTRWLRSVLERHIQTGKAETWKIR